MSAIERHGLTIFEGKNEQWLCQMLGELIGMT
jgi:hypothetical protein